MNEHFDISSGEAIPVCTFGGERNDDYRGMGRLCEWARAPCNVEHPAARIRSEEPTRQCNIGMS